MVKGTQSVTTPRESLLFYCCSLYLLGSFYNKCSPATIDPKTTYMFVHSCWFPVGPAVFREPFIAANSQSDSQRSQMQHPHFCLCHV